MSSIADRFKFVSNMGTFWDFASKKYLNADQLKKVVTEIDPQYADHAKFGQFADLLKDFPIVSADIATLSKSLKGEAKGKDGPSKVSLLNTSYTNIAPNFKLHFCIKEGAQIYFYQDNKGEVHPIFKEDLDGFTLTVRTHADLLALLVAEFDKPENEYLKATLSLDLFIAEMYKRFKYDLSKKFDTEPPAVSWDPNVPAYKQLDPSILQNGPTPTWDQFTSRLDFPEHFKAFIWSIFEPRNTGRQALYLYGAGFDGKSSAFSTIANVLGDRHTMSMNNQSLKNIQFFYGNIYGKRLVLYPDCKVTNVLRTEVIKSLLGSDKVEINKKFKDAFSATVNAKLMIGANRFPRIDPNDKSERTRLLFLKIAEIDKNSLGDNTFAPNLRAEIGPFLYQCRAAYEKLCPTHAEFKLPPEMIANIENDCITSEANILTEFIEDRLEFDPTYYIPRKRLENELKEEFGHSNNIRSAANALDDLQAQLFKRKVISHRPRLENGTRPHVFVGVRLIGDKTTISEFQKQEVKK